MLNVHILARPTLMSIVSNVTSAESNVTVTLRTNNVRQALDYRYASLSDLLIIDDQILADNPGLIENFARIPCRKLLVGSLTQVDVARRAIALRTVDLLEEVMVRQELPGLLKSLLTPQDTPMEGIVISVYSAKGGVGKSTLALNLAWGIALQSQHRAALMDVAHSGDIGAMIAEKPGATVSDVVAGLAAGISEEKALQSLYTVKGLDLTIVPAKRDFWESEVINPLELDRLIRLIKSTHAYVVLDMDTGLSDLNLAALDASDRILVIAAPEQVTLSTVRRSLDILTRLYRGKVSIVLNRAYSDTGIDVDQVETILGQKVYYVLPSGGNAPVKASNKGRALVVMNPKNALAKSIMVIAQEMVSLREASLRRPKRRLVRESTKLSQ